MGVAIGSCWMSYQAVTTYNNPFQKNYFYYLLAFYGFATYGIWGHMALQGLLAQTETEAGFLEAVANFPAILSIPFLLLSWGMLLKMGYSLLDTRPGRQTMAWHFAFLCGITLGAWILYFLASSLQFPGGPGLVQLGPGVLLLLELGYLSLFAVRVLNGLTTWKDPKRQHFNRFVWLMLLGWIPRAGALWWMPEGTWLPAFLLLVYFLSNAGPVLYLRLYSDLLFTPFFAQAPSEEKKQQLFDTYQLTPREREIVAQLCEGKTNQQIADALFIGLQTVKDHTHRIYSKIGIHSRLKLVQLVNG